MPEDAPHIRCFQFDVPGLPDVHLIVGVEQVVEVIDAGKITPVPVAAPFLIGLTEWRSEYIPIIDLAAALGQAASAWEASHWMVVRLILYDEVAYVAWPILAGASLVMLPTRAPAADILLPDSPLIRAVVTVDEQTVVLLDPGGLALIAAGQHSL